jgi:hypothetical protein
MQIPKCIKQNNPCDIHSRNTRVNHPCGVRIYKGHNKDAGKKISATLKRKGIKPPSKLGLTAWNKGLKGYHARELCHLWKGGITPENHKIRSSLEMKLFRKACMERDNFTCQKTGERGGRLVVHHINNFADFPELRTSIENGITLSKESHKEFHRIYGVKNNTKEQLLEFLINK